MVQGLRDHAGALIVVAIVCLVVVSLTAVGDCANSACEPFGLVPLLAAIIASLQIGWSTANDARRRSLVTAILVGMLSILTFALVLALPKGAPSNAGVISLVGLAIVEPAACLVLALLFEFAHRVYRATWQ